MIKKSKKALLFTSIFFSFYIGQSYSAYRKQVSNNLLSKQLCDLKEEHIRTSVYQYQNPHFGYIKRGDMAMYPLIKIRKNFFADRNTWEMVGMETRIPPIKNRGRVIEWYKYNNPENNLDLLCQPKANQGHCLFKVVYEGSFDLQYAINTHKKKLYPQENVRALVFGNNRVLSFPKNCKRIGLYI